MKLQLVAVGTKMPDWDRPASVSICAVFPKRMPFKGWWRSPAGKRVVRTLISNASRKEGEMMLPLPVRSLTRDIPVNHLEK